MTHGGFVYKLGTGSGKSRTVECKRKGRRNSMEIKVIEGAFSVCRLKELGQAMIEDDLYFLGRTD